MFPLHDQVNLVSIPPFFPPSLYLVVILPGSKNETDFWPKGTSKSTFNKLCTKTDKRKSTHAACGTACYKTTKKGIREEIKKIFFFFLFELVLWKAGVQKTAYVHGFKGASVVGLVGKEIRRRLFLCHSTWNQGRGWGGGAVGRWTDRRRE